VPTGAHQVRNPWPKPYETKAQKAVFNKIQQSEATFVDIWALAMASVAATDANNNNEQRSGRE
jgi:hypothetical protein